MRAELQLFSVVSLQHEAKGIFCLPWDVVEGS